MQVFGPYKKLSIISNARKLECKPEAIAVIGHLAMICGISQSHDIELIHHLLSLYFFS